MKRVYVGCVNGHRLSRAYAARDLSEQEELVLRCALTLQPSRSSTASPQHDCLSPQHAPDESARPSTLSARTIRSTVQPLGATFDQFLDEGGGNVTFSADRPNIRDADNHALGLSVCLTRASSCSKRSCSRRLHRRHMLRAVPVRRQWEWRWKAVAGDGVPQWKRRVEGWKSSSGSNSGGGV